MSKAKAKARATKKADLTERPALPTKKFFSPSQAQKELAILSDLYENNMELCGEDFDKLRKAIFERLRAQG